jgi:hypothetical protein
VKSANQHSYRRNYCGENPNKANNSPAAVGDKSLDITVHQDKINDGRRQVCHDKKKLNKPIFRATSPALEISIVTPERLKCL